MLATHRQLSATTPCLFIIVTSSQIIRDAIRSSLPVPLCFVKVQWSPSARVRGTPKREWAVIYVNENICVVVFVAVWTIVLLTAIFGCTQETGLAGFENKPGLVWHYQQHEMDLSGGFRNLPRSVCRVSGPARQTRLFTPKNDRFPKTQKC